MRVILVPKESYWSLLQLFPWWENLFQKLTCPKMMLNRDCTKLTVFRTRRKQILTKPQPKPPLNSRSKPQKSTQKEGIRVEDPHLGQSRATWQELRVFLFLLLLLLPFFFPSPFLLLPCCCTDQQLHNPQDADERGWGGAQHKKNRRGIPTWVRGAPAPYFLLLISSPFFLLFPSLSPSTCSTEKGRVAAAVGRERAGL
jgi:hypothetical protein